MFRKRQLRIGVILLLIVVVGFLVYSLDSPAVFAQGETITGLKEAAEEAKLPQQTNLGILVGRIIKYVIAFLGLILVIIIIIGGFAWMTSAGNPERVQKGKAMITNGIIGLAIIILSYVIANFIIEQMIKAGT